MSRKRQGGWHDWPFDPLPLLRSLHANEVEYVLIGGVAAVLQGSPLPTYDIDIVPAPGKRNRKRLLDALAALDAVVVGDLSDLEGVSEAERDLSFSTPFGYIDVHHRPVGFSGYAELRRGSRPIELEPGLTLRVSALRDIIRSRLAAGDHRQLPALEVALELESGS